jgi:N-acetyl-anhydromuramyl-L-alanine amidase AmpD
VTDLRPIFIAKNWAYPLTKGDKGDDVAGLQTFLVLAGYDLGPWGPEKNGVDGSFGGATANAVIAYRARFGLAKEAIVDADFIQAMTGKKIAKPRVVELPDVMVDLSTIRFIQAKNFTAGRYGEKVKHIVLHSMEASEASSTAENVAKWFAGPSAPRASAHYCIDDDSVVQCVKDSHMGWHAPGLNKTSIGIEHAGYARQTEEQWLDDFSKAMLLRSACLVGQLCAKYDIPVEFLDEDDLKAGKRGITTHHIVSKAFHKSDHWDPGKGFPFDWYLDQVRATAEKAGA